MDLAEFRSLTVPAAERSGASAGSRRITHSRHRTVLSGHGKTRRRRHLSSGGPLRSRQDTRGHATNTVRTVRPRVQIPGPGPISESELTVCADFS